MRIERVWTIPASGKGVLRRAFSQFFFYLAGRSLVSRLEPFDIVVGTSPPMPAAELGAWLAAARGVPFVMEVRDLWPDVIFDSGYTRLAPLRGRLLNWERSLYRRARMVVVVTQPFVDIIAGKGVPRERLAVFPPGYNFSVTKQPAAGNDLRSELGLTGRTVALYLGNHGESQGLEVLVEAAVRLDPQIHLLFVGDGWARPALMARARELGLANLTFAGAIGRERVAEYYALADLCLITLRGSELLQHFLPSKLIEVLAYGKHVLTNIGGEGAELITRLRAGQVLKEYTPKTVAAALNGYMHNSAKFASPESITTYMREHYDQRSIAQAYILELERVVRGER